jgi:hypothetical protein
MDKHQGRMRRITSFACFFSGEGATGDWPNAHRHAISAKRTQIHLQTNPKARSGRLGRQAGAIGRFVPVQDIGNERRDQNGQKKQTDNNKENGHKTASGNHI